MSRIYEQLSKQTEIKQQEKQMQTLPAEAGSTEIALSPEQEARALLEEASKGVQVILKFKEGYFHIRGEKMPLGTRYLAYVPNWERQWIRFDDNKVTDRIRVRVATRKLLPGRNTLSNPELEDTDNDPWSLQNVLPLEDIETGQLLTFVTQTAGGKMALEELAAKYSKDVLAGTAQGLPIIELRVNTFKSGFSTEVQKPLFKIAEWEMSPKQTMLPPKNLSNNIEGDPATIEQPAFGVPRFPGAGNSDDMDDEIPF
jgi:hypothetical protein